MPRQILPQLLCKPLYNSAFIATAFVLLSFIAAHADAPDEMELTLENGKTFTAYAAGPQEADQAIVILHDWFGSTPGNAENLTALEAPALAIYGSKDGDAATQAASFSLAMDKAGKHGEVYIYPDAAHAFAQPLFNAGKTYDGVAAEAAWKLTEDFLGQQR